MPNQASSSKPIMTRRPLATSAGNYIYNQTRITNMSKTALIVVDVQKVFCDLVQAAYDSCPVVSLEVLKYYLN
jgi:hypothetical protein